MCSGIHPTSLVRVDAHTQKGRPSLAAAEVAEGQRTHNRDDSPTDLD